MVFQGREQNSYPNPVQRLEDWSRSCVTLWHNGFHEEDAYKISPSSLLHSSSPSSLHPFLLLVWSWGLARRLLCFKCAMQPSQIIDTALERAIKLFWHVYSLLRLLLVVGCACSRERPLKIHTWINHFHTTLTSTKTNSRISLSVLF